MTDSYFITHPDVVIDPEVPVPRWPLSERGVARMRRCLEQPFASTLRCVFSSDEQKAKDGARILSEALGIPHRVNTELGENDRSATGFLPPDEFQRVADAFFARPHESVRGWERAVDAQQRVVNAIREAAGGFADGEPIAFVAHGGVGALLHCHLRGRAITREAEQPSADPGAPKGAGGGYYLAFDRSTWSLEGGWRRIDVERSASPAR